MDLLDRMLGYDRWATRRLLEQSRGLTDEQLDRQFDIGLGTLRDTFDHMIHVIDHWTAMMDGRPAPPERTGRPSIDELIERNERNSATFADVARRMRDENRLDETFIDHYDYPQSIGATILQIITHDVQHRSEARHILQRLGVSDLWDGDPQEWEHATGITAPMPE